MPLDWLELCFKMKKESTETEKQRTEAEKQRTEAEKQRTEQKRIDLEMQKKRDVMEREQANGQ